MTLRLLRGRNRAKAVVLCLAVASGSSATNEDGTIAADIGELPNSQTVTLDVPSGGWSA